MEDREKRKALRSMFGNTYINDMETKKKAQEKEEKEEKEEK